MKYRFEEVPPPKDVPVHQIAETLGLLPGLRADRSMSNFRCSNCSTYQMTGSWLVWVPDGVMSADSAEVIAEQCRQNAYNGHHSGWCIECAKKLGKNALAPAVAPIKSWWQRWFGDSP
jgi:hypothetical protein